MVTDPFATVDQNDELPLPPRSSNAGKNSAAEQGVEIPMNWKPTPKEPVPVVRCTGTATTTGERCKRWSLRGTTVCRKHGAQLPTVREMADAVVESSRLQLMGMADDAVDVLAELMQPGVADAVRLKAVENVLNRSGIKDAIEVHVEHSTVSQASEITKRLDMMRERMNPTPEPEDLGEIVDDSTDV